MTNGYSPAPAGKTGNLADCVTIKDMSAQEAAAAIASMAAKFPKTLGIGVWEGTIEGKISGNVYAGKHLGVFDANTLIALFGPHGDALSECTAALLVAIVQNADKIATALQNSQTPPSEQAEESLEGATCLDACPTCGGRLERTRTDVLLGVNRELFECEDCGDDAIRELTVEDSPIERAVKCVACSNMIQFSSAHIFHQSGPTAHFIGDCCVNGYRGRA
jgi:hypothetical protein